MSLFSNVFNNQTVESAFDDFYCKISPYWSSEWNNCERITRSKEFYGFHLPGNIVSIVSIGFECFFLFITCMATFIKNHDAFGVFMVSILWVPLSMAVMLKVLKHVFIGTDTRIIMNIYWLQFTLFQVILVHILLSSCVFALFVERVLRTRNPTPKGAFLFCVIASQSLSNGLMIPICYHITKYSSEFPMSIFLYGGFPIFFITFCLTLKLKLSPQIATTARNDTAIVLPHTWLCLEYVTRLRKYAIHLISANCILISTGLAALVIYERNIFVIVMEFYPIFILFSHCVIIPSYSSFLHCTDQSGTMIYVPVSTPRPIKDIPLRNLRRP